MSGVEILGLTLLATFCSMLSSVAGFGGGAILMGAMLLFLAPAQAIPVHGMVQLASNMARAWLFRQHIVWGMWLRFLAFMPAGIVVGYLFFQGLGKETVQGLIGAFILFTLCGRQIKRWRHREMPLYGLYPLGFVMGVLNIMVGVATPLMSILIVRRDLHKEAFVVTLGLFAVSGHALKVIAFGWGGFSFTQYTPLILAMIPAVTLGSWLGRTLLGRINERVFQLLIWVLAGGLGLKLVFWDSLRPLLFLT